MITLKFRRGTQATWAMANPILREGEPGFEVDTGKMKVGNGISTWFELPYILNQPQIQSIIDTLNAEGIKGDKGDKGDTGLQGPIGPAGPQGIPGVKGDKGDTGNSGAVGPQGIQGVKGDKGDTGSAGSAGATGDSVTVTLVPAASWPPAADSNPLHLYFRVP